MNHSIRYEEGRLVIPDHPELGCIPGDGIGPEVWAAARRVLDTAVEHNYGSGRSLRFRELPAGLAAVEQGLAPLPESTVEAIRRYRISIKGPTATPVGGGHRSVNVTLRRSLDLYSNIRPVHYFEGVETPVKRPEDLDVVIFRENTEDVYAGIEFAAGSFGADRLTKWLTCREFDLKPDTAFGVKVISRAATRRLIRAAVEYALRTGRKRVTIVHKGNILKETEGAFLRWGNELVATEYEGRAVLRSDLPSGASPPPGILLVDDCIADAMFQAVLLNPKPLSVIAAPNMTGDYLSDACAAQVGGLGLAPGANIGDGIALFEPTHGTAPDIAGKGIANPGSMILSGAMMLEHMGWTEASECVVQAFSDTLRAGLMTGDLARNRPGVRALSTDEFGQAVVDRLS